MNDTTIFLLILLLYLALFHYDARLLRGLFLLLGFYRSDYVLFVCTDIASTGLNWVRGICCTFWRIDYIYSITLRLLLIICTAWVWNHYCCSSSLFWCAFVAFALLWELWFTLLLLYNVSRFRVIFSGSGALFAENLSWSVDSYVLVRVFVTWVNSLDLIINSIRINFKKDNLLNYHGISKYEEISFCLARLFSSVRGDYIVLELVRDLKLQIILLHLRRKQEKEDFRVYWY